MKKNRRKNKNALRIAGIVFGHLILFLSVAFCGRMGEACFAPSAPGGNFASGGLLALPVKK